MSFHKLTPLSERLPLLEGVTTRNCLYPALLDPIDPEEVCGMCGLPSWHVPPTLARVGERGDTWCCCWLDLGVAVAVPQVMRSARPKMKSKVPARPVVEDTYVWVARVWALAVPLG